MPLQLIDGIIALIYIGRAEMGSGWAGQGTFLVSKFPSASRNPPRSADAAAAASSPSSSLLLLRL